MSQSWYLNETAHAGPEHFDSDYVATYDIKAGFDPTEDVDLLLARGLDSSRTVIDLGAGTGLFALAIAPYAARVIAVDPSPAMQQALRSKAAAQGVTNVECVQEGWLRYRPSAPADFIYSRNALHHLPDFWKVIALQRCASMLKPGGVLRLRDLVYAGTPAEAEVNIDRWLSNAAPDPSRGWTHAELETHVQEEFSTFAWLLETMLDHTGFVIEEREYAPLGVFAAYTCVRR